MNETQQCIRIIVYCDQIEFIQGMKDWFTNLKSSNVVCHISKEKTNDIIISIGAEKTLDTVQHSLMIKTLNEREIEGNFLNLIKMHIS